MRDAAETPGPSLAGASPSNGCGRFNWMQKRHNWAILRPGPVFTARITLTLSVVAPYAQ